MMQEDEKGSLGRQVRKIPSTSLSISGVRKVSKRIWKTIQNFTTLKRKLWTWKENETCSLQKKKVGIELQRIVQLCSQECFL